VISHAAAPFGSASGGDPGLVHQFFVFWVAQG